MPVRVVQKFGLYLKAVKSYHRIFSKETGFKMIKLNLERTLGYRVEKILKKNSTAGGYHTNSGKT